MSEIELGIVAEKKRTLGVTEDTYKELVKLGGYNETMDHIIRRCVDAYKREQAKSKK
jgi:predicted CopG family antitoxin